MKIRKVNPTKAGIQDSKDWIPAAACPREGGGGIDISMVIFRRNDAKNQGEVKCIGHDPCVVCKKT